MTVTIYHNPACGTSRNTLALIRATGVEPVVIEYLQTPPSRAELVSLITRMDMPVRDVMRRKGTPYADLGLDDPALGDDQLIDAMLAHPILINRPIVVGPKGVRLARPSEVVLEVLDQPLMQDFVKEDGEIIPAGPRLVELPEGSLSELRALLEATGLPCDDLEELGRRFYRLEDARGVIGWAGLEACGADALLRSLVVPEQLRGQGAGAALVQAMITEARRLGIARLWLLTTTAAPFFKRLGFVEATRSDAPPAIQATREFRDICPASADCMMLTLSDTGHA